ncbi:MAG: TatD family hydrolase [Gammaproteobacteria bacterium]|nr:TatD family hydrolase [Gammaproteobacteria bacterium]MCP5299609.1 TatD family hydrolase [Chromatiaceae bacterium]
MLVDSHCHLDRVDLAPYDQDFSRLMQTTRDAGVSHLLCVSIDLESYPDMLALVEDYPEISVSVGVHPSDDDRREPSLEELVSLAGHPRNVAIGETGLDYYRANGDVEWQRQRFRTHIRAAREAGKPLIIHTRDARDDTIAILREEKASEVGGVMHCFTETWEMAQAALELNFYISFSGIVTFRNAEALRDVAARIPDDRLLIETDSPYLAPVPFRGRPNEPRHVARVAEAVAAVRGVETDTVVRQSHDNFFRLFGAADR